VQVKVKIKTDKQFMVVIQSFDLNEYKLLLESIRVINRATWLEKHNKNLKKLKGMKYDKTYMERIADDTKNKIRKERIDEHGMKNGELY
jgi:predicted class III extradiol MEMO1 family dioxygenase